MNKLKDLFWIDKEYDVQAGSYIGMFDLAKGFAMLGIILVHCCEHYYPIVLTNFEGSPFVKLLLSPLTVLRYGYVPMLFMICGYGARKQPVLKNIKKNLKLFIIPYSLVTLAVLLTVLIKQWLKGGSLLGRLVYDVLPFILGFHPGFHRIGNQISQIGPIWFFWTYIFGSILLNIICHEKQQWLQIVIIMIGSIFAVSTRTWILPFCLQQIIICSGFMYAGMCLKKARFTQRTMPGYAYLLIYAACTFGTTIGGLTEIANNIYFLGVQDLLLAYIAGTLLVHVGRRLDVCRGILADGIRWLGRHMLWICCFHTVAYVAVPWNKVVLILSEYKLLGLGVDFILNFIYPVTAAIFTEKIIKVFYEKKSERRRIG